SLDGSGKILQDPNADLFALAKRLIGFESIARLLEFLHRLFPVVFDPFGDTIQLFFSVLAFQTIPDRIGNPIKLTFCDTSSRRKSRFQKNQKFVLNVTKRSFLLFLLFHDAPSTRTGSRFSRISET